MNEIKIYKSPDNQIELQVSLEKETVWLSQKQMALLFAKSTKTINEHIINIYKESELEKTPTIRNFQIVQKEGKRNIEREIEHYNLDVIISVGYRVKSKRGTQFRQWATQRLKDYLVKGFSVNEKRLQETETQFRELKQAVALRQSILKKAFEGKLI